MVVNRGQEFTKSFSNSSVFVGRAVNLKEKQTKREEQQKNKERPKK